MTMEIREGGLDDERVIALIIHHRETAAAATAVCSSHSLGVEQLRAPDITFFSCWEHGVLLGIGALRMLGPEWAEIKSMHTAREARRKGVGRLMLRHLIAVAWERGVQRINLETGSWDYFEPSRQMYRSEGFVACPQFAEYRADPNSCFFELRRNALKP